MYTTGIRTVCVTSVIETLRILLEIFSLSLSVGGVINSCVNYKIVGYKKELNTNNTTIL